MLTRHYPLEFPVNKNWLLVGAMLALVALAAALPWLILQADPPRFSEKQCREIRAGMTRIEVIAVLGAPPGDYTDGTGDYRIIVGGQIMDGSGVPTEQLDHCWCGYDGMIGVWFDEQGRVVTASFYHAWPDGPRRPSLWERVKRWLPLQ